MSKLIIDVSYHNGVINWEKVKASGCAGAILRCGYGDDIISLVTDRLRANLTTS